MTTLTRRRALTAAGAAMMAPALPSFLRAQAWPVPTITLVVPFPAGGSVDALARLAQVSLQQSLGATVIVENRPGASGSVGTASVAKAKGDGATWLFVFDTHGVNPTLFSNLAFDTEKDLEPVTLIGTAPHIIATHPSRPYKSWADMVTASKAKEGGLNYGSIGTGSLGHLTMLQLAKRGGFPATHVPYRGGGPLMNDFLGGQVDLAIASTGLFGPQLSAGTIVPLLQTGAQRLAVLKDVPTAIDAGFAGFTSVAWWGVFAPKGTPDDLVARFRTALIAAFREERAAKQISQAQQIDVALGEPARLRTFLAEQIATWRTVIRDNDIKPGT